MYNMHMLDKIISQVSRNVQILIRETFIYMIMDAELATSLRSRDECEVLSIDSHHGKINIMESSAGDLCVH